mmetsp:Transcript_64807/g.181195  ORF Transcript_64807/g.181195 Transcript_64807/m.181195 type:complete len:379 (+) Transcript_64807:90-1226(+)
MGKRAAGAKGKQASDEGPASADPAPSSSKRSQRKKQGAWPTWLWFVGGFALVVSLGRVFTGDSSAPSKRKKASDLSPARFLELALRLQEMTEIASALAGGDELDSDAAKQLDAELKEIEGELGSDSSSTSRDLRSMVSVVRGTLYQKSEKLTDEEVESLGGNSFTYANPRYWDDYYNRTTEDETYDWYGTWETAVTDRGDFVPRGASEPQPAGTLGQLLGPYLAKESDILMFGCGNSDLSEKMYVQGYEGITNIDISEKLLANLRGRLQDKTPKMRWVFMNVSELTFADASFDSIIDKGTLDAIEGNQALLRAAVAETHRALRPGGVLLSITFNNEENRVQKQLREVAEWSDCRTHSFERISASSSGRNQYFLHACQK